MTGMTRRDFLKSAGALASAALLPGVASWLGGNFKPGGENTKPNIIILLFDAMSARNLSLYGYPRQTAPNMERFAERATVYHAHTAGGNYTIPGVASLLTGAYPWTHRAINHSGVMRRDMVSNTLFHAIGADYHRIAFPQSVWANFIVTQFLNDVDTYLPPGAFSELDYLLFEHFPNDANLALRSLDDFAFDLTQYPISPVMGTIQRALYARDSAQLPPHGYPNGVPHNVNYPLRFRLEELFSGVGSLLASQTAPFVSYIHLFPPHSPYKPTREFFNQFNDGWSPVRKPVHRFSDNSSETKMWNARRIYDEYIASVDLYLGELLDSFEAQGVFENSYVILTSDHGEMFERGEIAHSTPLLYDPVIHIPLLISAPGQASRQDIHAPTNAVDILPTLASLAGKPIPEWCEGKPLPGFGGAEDFERSVYSVEAKSNPAFGPLNQATVAMRKGNLKLMYYTGYEADESFELYDLDQDAEELQDLYPDNPSEAKRMKDELLDALDRANQPYAR
jgi:arylsulfatase A-like enzyme